MNKDVTVGDRKKTMGVNKTKKSIAILIGVFLIGCALLFFFRPEKEPTPLEKTVASNSERITVLEESGKTVFKSLTVNTPNSNVRRGAGTSFEIINTLTVGDSVAVGKAVGDWLPLTTGGFIHKSLVN